MTSSLPNNSNKYLITQSMLENLTFDQNMESTAKITTNNKSNTLAMCIFHQSDLEAATYHLAKSIDDPNYPHSIRYVFIQESCVDRFKANLKSKLKSYTKDQLISQNSKETNEIVSKLSAETISPETSFTYASTLVWNFTQEYFKADNKILPVVCLFTFRTVKEAIAMIKKETTFYKGATIWCENQAMAYELIHETPLEDYYLNCCNVAWTPIKQFIEKAQPYALIENSYHYETLQASGKTKNIVFPFGTTFAN